MIKKQKKLISILIVGLVWVFVGCSKPSIHEKLSKDDQTLSYISEREKNFNNADYLDLKTEDEALEIVKDKYKLSIPKSYEQFKEVLTRTFDSEGVEAGESKYSVFSKDGELEFRTIYPFYEKEKLRFITRVSLIYEFLGQTKQVRLKRQEVNVVSAIGNDPFLQKKLYPLTQDIAGIMKLPEGLTKDGIAGYEKQIKELQDPIRNDSVAIVTNTVGINENEELAKSISAIYNNLGEFKEVNAEISDNTK
ncbi:hypothetical protein [Enterococcus ureasiticus]|uniref:Uncharacterized protein n=1 Tax=Enterococcus ureasiticus TaxID=903984 RepID=A0A1E5GAI4_9ENTE|nr:hypothetical protein [Enterococcus ureasiticus]OEG09714.1 hypothetical protein BCR21_15355 [Enterococcus ureasiticus]